MPAAGLKIISYHQVFILTYLSLFILESIYGFLLTMSESEFTETHHQLITEAEEKSPPVTIENTSESISTPAKSESPSSLSSPNLHQPEPMAPPGFYSSTARESSNLSIAALEAFETIRPRLIEIRGTSDESLNPVAVNRDLADSLMTAMAIIRDLSVNVAKCSEALARTSGELHNLQSVQLPQMSATVFRNRARLNDIEAAIVESKSFSRAAGGPAAAGPTATGPPRP
jgi:hypothetical protein